MLKLIKYFKPFRMALFMAVILLFGQAMTDLSLPDYMSNIVNVGIQQNGNEEAFTEILRPEDLENMVYLSQDENKDVLSQAYEPLIYNSEAYKSLTKGYDQPPTDLLVIKSNVSDEDKEVITNALLTYQMFQKSDDTTEFKFMEMTFPAGTDLLAWLKAMPEEETTQILTSINMTVSKMDPSLRSQAGISASTALYTDLGRDMDAKRSSYILTMGLYMLGLTLLGALASISVGYIAAKVAAGLGRNLREKLFDKISHFSNAEFDKFSTASLITRSTNDVMQVQNLTTMMIRMMIYAPIMAFGGILKAIDNNSSMTWIIALAVGIILVAIFVVFSVAMPKFKIVQKLVDKVNLVMRENLTGMMVIRAFNTQDFEEDRFDQANQELTNTNLFVNRIMVALMPFMNLVMNGVMILIVFVGAKEISNSSMQVGDMMAFMQYAMQIIMAFLMMSMMFIMIPRASVAAGRIVEVLDTPLEILDPENPKSLPKALKGLIEFNKVTFKYPGAEEAMLKDVSFQARPGETTAIIGSTGSGKTTLVNLMPRLYDPTEGEILLDGINIKDIKQHELREHMGYMPQKASLFSGQVQSNLKFAKDNASKEEQLLALKTAQCEEFIPATDEGLEQKISQGGSNLSGGQKQRLSIARALIKQPKIYIFDDSFSALDFKTDVTLRQSLKNQTGEQTLIIVAQRISTIKNAEQIIVLEDGQIVGKGVHDDLMKTCKTYQEIAYSQLSKEELS